MAAYLLMMFLMLLSMLFNGIVAGIYNVSITGNSKEIPTEDIVYEKPWSRVGAYLVGCFIGFSIFELKLKEKYRELSNTFFNSMYLKLQESRILSLIFSIVGTGFTSMVIFPLGGAYTCKEENWWARFPSALYAMLARPLFVFGVGLIVMPTIVGRLRFLIHFLGSETFSVLARLTYVVYMIHIVIMLWVLLDVRQGLYASSLGQWIFGIGTWVISFLVAIPVSMMWEVPFLNIEKYLLFPQRKIQDKPNKEFEKESMLIKKNEGLEYSDNMTRDSK